MLRQSISSRELGYKSDDAERKTDIGAYGGELRENCQDDCLIKETREDRLFRDDCPSWSTSSFYIGEITQNSTECFLATSDVDQWLSLEILAPLASREDARLTSVIKRSRSFCYGESRNSSQTEKEQRVTCDRFSGEDSASIKEYDRLKSPRDIRKEIKFSWSANNNISEYKDSVRIDGTIETKVEGDLDSVRIDGTIETKAEGDLDSVRIDGTIETKAEGDLGSQKYQRKKAVDDGNQTVIHKSFVIAPRADSTNCGCRPVGTDNESSRDSVPAAVVDAGLERNEGTGNSDETNQTDSKDLGHQIEHSVIVASDETDQTGSKDSGHRIEQSVYVVHSSNIYLGSSFDRCIQVSVKSDQKQILAESCQPDHVDEPRCLGSTGSESFISCNSDTQQNNLCLSAADDTKVRKDWSPLLGFSTDLNKIEQGHLERSTKEKDSKPDLTGTKEFPPTGDSGSFVDTRSSSDHFTFSKQNSGWNQGLKTFNGKHDTINTAEVSVNTAEVSVITAEVSVITAEVSVNTAEDSVNTAEVSVNTAEDSVNTAEVSVNTAEVSINTAEVSVNTAEDSVNTAEVSVNTAEDSVNTAEVSVNTAEDSVNTAEVSVNTAEVSVNTAEDSVNTAEVSVNTAEVSVNTAEVSVNTAEDSVNTAEVSVNTAEVSVNTAEDSVNTAEVSVNTAEVSVNTAEDSVNTAEVSVNTAEDSVNTAEVSVNTAEVSINTAEVSVNTAEDSVNTAEVSVNTAEVSVNTAEDSVNTAEVSVNTAEDSVNTAEVSVNTAEDSVNKVVDNVTEVEDSSQKKLKTSCKTKTFQDALTEDEITGASSLADTQINTPALGVEEDINKLADTEINTPALGVEDINKLADTQINTPALGVEDVNKCLSKVVSEQESNLHEQFADNSTDARLEDSGLEEKGEQNRFFRSDQVHSSEAKGDLIQPNLVQTEPYRPPAGGEEITKSLPSDIPLEEATVIPQCYPPLSVIPQCYPPSSVQSKKSCDHQTISRENLVLPNLLNSTDQKFESKDKKAGHLDLTLIVSSDLSDLENTNAKDSREVEDLIDQASVSLSQIPEPATTTKISGSSKAVPDLFENYIPHTQIIEEKEEEEEGDVGVVDLQQNTNFKKDNIPCIAHIEPEEFTEGGEASRVVFFLPDESSDLDTVREDSARNTGGESVQSKEEEIEREYSENPVNDECTGDSSGEFTSEQKVIRETDFVCQIDEFRQEIPYVRENLLSREGENNEINFINDTSREYVSNSNSSAKDIALKTEDDQPVPQDSVTEERRQPDIPEEDQPVPQDSVTEERRQPDIPEEDQPVPQDSVTEERRQPDIPEEDQPVPLQSVQNSVTEERRKQVSSLSSLTETEEEKKTVPCIEVDRQKGTLVCVSDLSISKGKASQSQASNLLIENYINRKGYLTETENLSMEQESERCSTHVKYAGRLNMEKDRGDCSSNARIFSKDNKSEKYKRMNSDSALLYEKSRQSLGVLLEEINDLVRRTSSFECSDLDIRYKPVKDKDNRRKEFRKQSAVRSYSDKGLNREKFMSAEDVTDDTNLLRIVEMYGDGKKTELDDDKDDNMERSESVAADVVQMDILSLRSVCGEEHSKEAEDIGAGKQIQSDSSKISQCKIVGGCEIKREKKTLGKESPGIEKTSDSDDSRTLHPDSRKVSAVEVKPPECKSSERPVSKKGPKKRFPLRTLRRKTSLTNVSLLDVNEVSFLSDDTIDTEQMTAGEVRSIGTVGHHGGVTTGDYGGLSVPRSDREKRIWSRATMKESRCRDPSEKSHGSSTDKLSILARRKSYQTHSSGNLSSFIKGQLSNHFSFDKGYVAKSGSSFEKKSSSGSRPGLDSRHQKEDSRSNLHQSMDLSHLRKQSKYSQSDLHQSIDSSHLRQPPLRVKGDVSYDREKANSKIVSSHTTTANKSAVSDKQSLDETPRAHGKFSNARNSSEGGRFPPTRNISEEVFSAFNKVMKEETGASRKTSHRYRSVVKDGPLSLHESTIMMNEDTGQSPHKSGSQSMEDPSQNSTEQMNGQVNFDEICNVKNLKDEEILPRVAELVQALRGLDEYDRGDTMKILKSVGDTYWSYRAIRKKIGNILADEGFAEITMKILKTLNGKGIFKNDSIWFPVYYCFNTLWNYSDSSLKLAKSIADNDGVRFFTINCDHEPYIKNLHSKNVYYVVKASMSILHNISRTTDIHHYFKENGTTEVMLKFATWKDLTYEMLKVMSLLTLAHIVEEEDNDKLIDETGAIEGCIKYINKALKNEKRRHLGFTPHELMDGMSKLAVNDKNKKKIIDAGALPVLLQMLKGEHSEEQAITARAIWTLSFDKEVCQQIVEFPEMLERLESLKSSQDKEVLKNVNGALFVLKGENDVSKRPKSAKKNKGHVFISYSWNEKETIMKIRERLKKEGVEVWIDVERMGGSTLAAMAEAVENAALVLVCMSEKYKQSPNCRLEAEYTFQLRKEYIPLMVQKRYRPDGWLGFILGAKLYFDFSGKYPFEKPWNGLMKELKGMGRLSVLDNSDKTDAPIVSSSSSMYGSQPIRQNSTSSRIHQMSTEDVSNWLCSLKLDGCVPSFAQFDGKLLSQLKSMKSEAAEFYYHCLEKKLNMNIVEILTFTEGLEKL